jgi:hypothetical protein
MPASAASCSSATTTRRITAAGCPASTVARCSSNAEAFGQSGTVSNTSFMAISF